MVVVQEVIVEEEQATAKAMSQDEYNQAFTLESDATSTVVPKVISEEISLEVRSHLASIPCPNAIIPLPTLTAVATTVPQLFAKMHERNLFDKLHELEDHEKQVGSTYVLNSLLFKSLTKSGLFIISFAPGICTHTPKLAYGGLTKCVDEDFILSHQVFEALLEKELMQETVGDSIEKHVTGHIEKLPIQFLNSSLVAWKMLKSLPTFVLAKPDLLDIAHKLFDPGIFHHVFDKNFERNYKAPQLDSLVMASIIVETSLPALLGCTITSFDPGSNLLPQFHTCEEFKTEFKSHCCATKYEFVSIESGVNLIETSMVENHTRIRSEHTVRDTVDWSYATKLVIGPHSSTEVSLEASHQFTAEASSAVNLGFQEKTEVDPQTPLSEDLTSQNPTQEVSDACVPTYCQHWSLYQRKEQVLTWQQILSQAPANTHSKFTHEESSKTTCSNNWFFPINMYSGPSDLSHLMANQLSSDHDWGPSLLPMAKSSTYHLRLIHVLHFVKAIWPTHRTYTFMDCASTVLLIDGLTLLTWVLLVAWRAHFLIFEDLQTQTVSVYSLSLNVAAPKLFNWSSFAAQIMWLGHGIKWRGLLASWVRTHGIFFLLGRKSHEQLLLHSIGPSCYLEAVI